jgi:hypothetical protein
MSAQLFLFVFAFIFCPNAHQSNTPFNHFYTIGTIQDTLPPLHSISGNEISKVTSSFENATVIVTLKNGTIYTYHRPDWDFEDYYPSTVQAVKDAISKIKITFTKAEKMPEFPGGEDAWEKYLNEFCLQHQQEIENYGPKELRVSFIVHIHGQVSDIRMAQDGTDSKLSSLAFECIKTGPAWLPAVQNGRPVPCYQIQVIKLSR